MPAVRRGLCMPHADSVGLGGSLLVSLSCVPLARQHLAPTPVPSSACSLPQLGDGDTWRLGALEVRVFDTPGHTRGHICFWMPHADALFCGGLVQLTRSRKGRSGSLACRGGVKGVIRRFASEVSGLALENVGWGPSLGITALRCCVGVLGGHGPHQAGGACRVALSRRAGLQAVVRSAVRQHQLSCYPPPNTLFNPMASCCP